MPHLSAKPHRERMARAERGRHLCSAQWLHTWTCENGLQQCGAWSVGYPLVVIVRAGVVWSGVGTLAVALLVGLRLPPPVASPSWARGTSCGRPAGGSAPPPNSSLTQLGSRYLLRSPCWWVCASPTSSLCCISCGFRLY